MAGSSNITGLESIIFADNASFDGTERGGALNADGELWIGSATLPRVRKGTLVSSDNTIGIQYAAPNIDLVLPRLLYFVWQTITADQQLDPGTGYMCIAPGGAILLNLPTVLSSQLGDTIEVLLDGATSFTIEQDVGQQIRLGNQETTLGNSGSIVSTQQGDWIRLVCQGGGRWIAHSNSGNLTVN